MPDLFIQRLKKRFQEPLPGIAAQFKMAHATRKLYKTAVPENAKKAGVMALLFQKNEEWNILLIERKKINGDIHGGQLGFPGGRFETEDETLSQTALRETEEEIGVPVGNISLLGALTDLYIPVSNFQVYPYVGHIKSEPKYRLQENEVSAVLEVPISHFQNPMIMSTTDIRIGNNLILKNVPYYKVWDKVLWGATAMIISELIQLVDSHS